MLTKTGTITRIHRHFVGQTVTQETLFFQEDAGDGLHVTFAAVLTDEKLYGQFNKGDKVTLTLTAEKAEEAPEPEKEPETEK